MGIRRRRVDVARRVVKCTRGLEGGGERLLQSGARHFNISDGHTHVAEKLENKKMNTTPKQSQPKARDATNGDQRDVCTDVRFRWWLWYLLLLLHG